MTYELIHEWEEDGFDIKLYITPETEQPDWDMSQEEYEKLTADIYSGELLWFVAKVTASKCGVELGTDYLGGCCYKSIEEFVKPGDHFDNMVDAAIAEANKRLNELRGE